MKIQTKKRPLIAALGGLALLTASLIPAATTLADTPKNLNAKLDFDKAQEIVLKEAKQGKLINLELEGKKNKVYYEATVLDGETEKEYKIDGNNGKVLKTSSENIADDAEDVQLSKATPKLSFDDAQKKAQEKYPNAKLYEVELDLNDNDQLIYKIKLVENNKKIKLKLDADNGKLISEKTR